MHPNPDVIHPLDRDSLRHHHDLLYCRRALASRYPRFATLVSEESEQLHIKGLKDQEGVERQHDGRAGNRRGLGRAAVGEAAHDVDAPGEQHKRDHWKWQGDAEHDLAEDERLRRVDADRDDDEGRQHRHQPAQPDRDREPTNPCMIIWPANVPTTELDTPEATSETRNAPAAAAPSNGVSAW